MKTMKQLLKQKAALLKYVMLSIFVYTATCGQEAGCTGGVVTPITLPDPEFSISYTFIGEDQAKVYFTPDQSVVINRLIISENTSGFTQDLKFSYPFLICNEQQQQYINQYFIPQKGKEWTFWFKGVSRSTSKKFNVSKTKTIQ